jgi:hypothetical protein
MTDRSKNGPEHDSPSQLQLGRRGFLGTTLGTTLAVAAGAGVGLTLARPLDLGTRRARFAFGHGAEAAFAPDLGAFPDCPVTVECVLPGARSGALVKAWLHIATPNGNLVRELPPTRVERGLAYIEATLAYPFEKRVPGTYAYHVEVACNGQRVVTEAPATFSVRKFHWFS